MGGLIYKGWSYISKGVSLIYLRGSVLEYVDSLYSETSLIRTSKPLYSGYLFWSHTNTY